MQRRLPLLLAAAAVTALVACGGETPSESSSGCTSDDDCANGTCVGGLCVADDSGGGTDAATDAGRDDGGDDGGGADTSDDTDPGDTTGADTADDVDPSTDAEADVPDEPGDFGAPCEDDDDCISRLCLDLADGGVCTERCSGECPDPDWECRLLAGSGGDLIEICVPPRDVLCNACERDVDCGGLDDLCVPQLDGNGCGLACDTNDDCPTGFICQDVESVGGRGDQCVPELGICGGCLDADDDRHGEGPSCLGPDCEDLDPSIYDGAAELCDGADNDCDEVIDEGFDFQRSPVHCGRCGNACDAENADTVCAEGACAIETCDAGYYDIDGDYENGCEYACTPSEDGEEVCNEVDDDCDGEIDEDFDLDTDVANCGRCERACALDAAVAACIDAECAVAECVEPRADCNGAVDDGCEIDTDIDVNHCGGCGVVCDVPSATAACADGVCGVGVCDADRGDCNGDVEDGCEITLSASVMHCGACDAACPAVANGTPTCVDSACGIGRCDDGWLDCNGDLGDGCEAGDRDVTSCLRCGNVCAFDNGIAGCSDDGCFLDRCAVGYVNLDGDAGNGCEYECTVTNGGTEICDDLDNDCDGSIDESAIDAPTWYDDRDGDGYGRAAGARVDCEAPTGFVDRDGDCNDGNPAVYPGATEVCNGVNDDCDDETDEGLSFDRDGDGRYAIGSCATPADDCNDSEPRSYPGNVEVCDGVDNDCDRTVDETGAVGCTTYFRDGDGDGYGDARSSQCTCMASGVFDVVNDRDCFDGNATANPAQTGYFTSSRGDGNYDYNCNGVEERRWTQRSGTCSLFGDLCDGGNAGWAGSPPACGGSATWEQNCEFYVEAWPPSTGCRWASRASRTQACR